MAHDKVYVFCENMCKEEGMTKEQIEESFPVVEKQTMTLSGSNTFKVVFRRYGNVVNIHISSLLNAGSQESLAEIIPEKFRCSEENLQFGDSYITCLIQGNIIRVTKKATSEIVSSYADITYIVD